MRRILYSILVFALFAGLTKISAADPLLHDVHISFGRAELHGTSFVAKLTIYRDDFLRALENWHPGGYAGMAQDDFLQLEYRYVANYFRVWQAGGTQCRVSTSSFSEDGASLTFTLTYDLRASRKPSLTIDNRILFREYGDQTNILVLQAFGKEVSHVFTSASTTYYFEP